MKHTHPGLLILFCLLIPRIFANAGPGAAPAATHLQGIGEQAHSHLSASFLPFWYQHSWDTEKGGFVTQLENDGSWYEPNDRRLIMQARMIWTFAAAHRKGLRSLPYLERALEGMRYVESAFRDPEHGGYYYAVNRNRTPTETIKTLYSHAFLLYAYSELALASGDPDIAQAALGIFELIEAKTKDTKRPGYLEDFERDWSPRSHSSVSGMTDVKTLNTHMHLMEAYTTFVKAVPGARQSQALDTLTRLIIERSIESEMGFAYEPYSLDFEPIPNRDHEWVTSYSHNIELAWLLVEAAEVLEWEPSTYQPLILRMVDHALRFGFDPRRGALLTAGPADASPIGEDGPPEDTLIGWWEQAETLVGLLYAYRIQPDRHYSDALIQTWHTVWNEIIDHDRGGWFYHVGWHSHKPPSDRMGSEWKAAYHDGRCLMQLSRFLGHSEP